MAVELRLYSNTLFTREQVACNIGQPIHFHGPTGCGDGIVLDIEQMIDDAGRPYLRLTVDDALTPT